MGVQYDEPIMKDSGHQQLSLWIGAGLPGNLHTVPVEGLKFEVLLVSPLRLP